MRKVVLVGSSEKNEGLDPINLDVNTSRVLNQFLLKKHNQGEDIIKAGIVYHDVLVDPITHESYQLEIKLRNTIIYWPKKVGKNKIDPRFGVASTMQLGKGKFGSVVKLLTTLKPGINGELIDDMHIPRVVKQVVLDDVTIEDVQQEVQLSQMAQLAGVKKEANYTTKECYIVMREIKGETLESASRNKKLYRIDQLFQITLSLLRELQQIHARGVIHRDISHTNILIKLDDYQFNVVKGEFYYSIPSVKIIDFGLGRFADSEDGAVCGQEKFIAPEAFSGVAQLDAISDIYSMGMVLWYLWRGQDMTLDVIEQAKIGKDRVLFGLFKGLAEFAGRSELESIIKKMISYERTARPGIQDIIHEIENARLAYKRQGKSVIKGYADTLLFANQAARTAIGQLYDNSSMRTPDVLSCIIKNALKGLNDSTLAMDEFIEVMTIHGVRSFEKVTNKQTLVDLVNKMANDWRENQSTISQLKRKLIEDKCVLELALLLQPDSQVNSLLNKTAILIEKLNNLAYRVDNCKMNIDAIIKFNASIGGCLIFVIEEIKEFGIIKAQAEARLDKSNTLSYRSFLRRAEVVKESDVSENELRRFHSPR